MKLTIEIIYKKDPLKPNMDNCDVALGEVERLLHAGYNSGHNSNEFATFYFKHEEE